MKKPKSRINNYALLELFTYNYLRLGISTDLYRSTSHILGIPPLYPWAPDFICRSILETLERKIHEALRV